MSYITLTKELTPDGVVCTHPVLGKVATIEPSHKGGWYVRPYAFPCYEAEAGGVIATRGQSWASIHAAEHHALAIAYEMQALGMPDKLWTGEDRKS